MEAIKALYLKAYFIIMALYVYLNKGIAYSFLVEALWLGGIILLILNRHKYIFIWEKRSKILLFFMRRARIDGSMIVVLQVLIMHTIYIPIRHFIF
jgi:hypothetical protein